MGLYWTEKFREICKDKKLSNLQKLMKYLAFAEAEEKALEERLKKALEGDND